MNKVDKYIEKQPSPQKDILNKLRKLILKTFPKINEEIKMGVPWYEGKFYLVGLKDHVNLGFSVGGLLNSKYLKQLEGTGKYMRHIKLFTLEDINEEKLVKLLKITYKKFKLAHS